MGCERVRSGSNRKCRPHLGFCLTSNCRGPVAAGKQYCTACEMARNPRTPVRETTPDMRAKIYAHQMEKTKWYRDHVADVLKVLAAIGTTRTFNQYLDELAGWKNLKSWARWAGRAIEPSILKKARFTAIVEVLTPQMQAASLRRAYFAQEMLEEMILICNAEKEKADIAFIVSQAFMVFGPLLAPFTAAAGAAAAGHAAGSGAQAASLATRGAISVGRQLGQMGINAGAGVLEVGTPFAPGMSESNPTAPAGAGVWDRIQTRERSGAMRSAAPPPPLLRTAREGGAGDRGDHSASPRMSPQGTGLSDTTTASREERYHYSVNPMQYAICLFKYLTRLASPSASEQLVIDEFGGTQNLARLYEDLKYPPMD